MINRIGWIKRILQRYGEDIVGIIIIIFIITFIVLIFIVGIPTPL